MICATAITVLNASGGHSVANLVVLLLSDHGLADSLARFSFFYKWPDLLTYAIFFPHILSLPPFGCCWITDFKVILGFAKLNLEDLQSQGPFPNICCICVCHRLNTIVGEIASYL